MKSTQVSDEYLRKILPPSDKYTFLVGAGISINPPSNMPSVRQMIETMLQYGTPAAEFHALLEKKIQFEQFIELFREVFSNLEFLDYFDTATSYNLIHLFLAKAIIAKHYVLTTNFDNLIEHALLDVIPQQYHNRIKPIITKADFESNLDLETLSKEGVYPLIKLHGSKRNAITEENCTNSIIVTTTDLIKEKSFRTIFSLEEYKASLFRQATENRSLVVLGYSGSDVFDIVPTLKQIQNIKRLVWIDHNPELQEQFEVVNISNKKSAGDLALWVKPDLIDIFNQKNWDVFYIQANSEYFVRTILWNSIIPKEIIPEPTQNSGVRFSKWVEDKLPQVSELTKYRLAAHIYLLTSDFSKFYQCTEQAIVLSEIQKDNPKISMNTELGFYYYLKDDFTRALDLFRKSYEYHLQTNDPDSQISDLANIAKVLSAQDNVQEAKKIYQDIYQTYKKRDDKVGQAEMLNNIAVMNLSENNYDEALHKLVTATKLARETGSNSLYVSARSNLGFLYQNLGSYDLAFQEYNECLKVVDNLGDLYGTSQLLFDIGLLHDRLGNIDLAVETLEKVIKIDDQIDAYNIKVNHLRSLAETYSKAGKLDFAIDTSNKAIGLAKYLDDKKEIVQCFGSHGLILQKAKLYDQALAVYLEQAETAKIIGDFSTQIVALDCAGRICRLNAKFEKSFEYYTQAHQLALQIKDENKEFLVLYHIGETYYHWGKYKEALSYFSTKILPFAIQLKNPKWIQQAHKDIDILKRKVSH